MVEFTETEKQLLIQSVIKGCEQNEKILGVYKAQLDANQLLSNDFLQEKKTLLYILAMTIIGAFMLVGVKLTMPF